jgi:hypothetical protein
MPRCATRFISVPCSSSSRNRLSRYYLRSGPTRPCSRNLCGMTCLAGLRIRHRRPDELRSQHCGRVAPSRDARVHAIAARHCSRGARIAVLFCCGALGRDWHEADKSKRLPFVRFRREADMPKPPLSHRSGAIDPNRSFASKPKAPFLPTHFFDVSGVMLRTRWQA